MAGELDGKIALVTGAGTGIGKAIATLFAQHGATVIVNDINDQSAQAVVREIHDRNEKAMAAPADVGRRDTAQALVREAAAEAGGLDILVHNAGVFPPATVADQDEAGLDRTLAINLKACFWLTQAALPFLEKSSSPRVIITSSLAGNTIPVYGMGAYCASKAGVNGFVKTAALELGPKGITVNCVEPGLVATEIATRNFPEIHEMGKQMPLRRVGKPADIANAMLFLALPQSGYVTGQAIRVEGGGTLVTPLGGFTALPESA